MFSSFIPAVKSRDGQSILQPSVCLSILITLNLEKVCLETTLLDMFVIIELEAHFTPALRNKASAKYLK